MTAAVNSLTSATFSDLGKNGQNQRLYENPEYSDNSETAKVDEILTIHENCTLYQEQKKVTANAFLEIPFENDTIFSVAINGFSDYYNVDDEKWGYLVVSHRQNPKCSHASFY